jgi:hypothetical protein
MDIERADALADHVHGLWQGPEPTAIAEALDKIAASLGAWWGVDRYGVYRFRILIDPTSETALLTINAVDMVRHLQRLDSELPTYKQTIRYQPNYTVLQGLALAGGVSTARRGVLARSALEVSATTASVQTAYLLASEAFTDSLMDVRADASTEATRRQALRGTYRDRYSFAVPLNDETQDIDLGTILTVKHPRFELTAGKTFVVMHVEPDAKSESIELEVWG